MATIMIPAAATTPAYGGDFYSQAYANSYVPGGYYDAPQAYYVQQKRVYGRGYGGRSYGRGYARPYDPAPAYDRRHHDHRR